MKSKAIDLNGIGQVYAGGKQIREMYVGTELVWSETDGRLELYRLDDGVKQYDINELSDEFEGRLFFSTGQYVDDFFRPEFGRNGLSGLVSVNDKQSDRRSGLTALQSVRNCANLSSIVMPNVKVVFENACYGCSSLERIVMPKVEIVADMAFCGCKSLSSIALPTISSLGSQVFANCENLKDVQLDGIEELTAPVFHATPVEAFRSQHMKKVSDGFSDAATLVSVDLPEVVSAYRAFFGCYNMTSANMPSLLSAGPRSFFDCEKLSEIPNQHGIRHIGQEAFYNCEGISRIDAESLETIGKYGCGGCASLQTVKLSSIRTIEECAFSNCAQLREIRFTDGVPTLCSSTFAPISCLMSFDDIGDYRHAMSSDIWKDIHFNVRYRPVADSGVCCLVDLGGIDTWLSYTSEKTGGQTVTYTDVESQKPAFPYTYSLLNGNSVYRADAVTALTQLREFRDETTGVTELQPSCFIGCSNLTSVSLYGLNKIGAFAFSGTGLVSVDLPNAGYAGKAAFDGTQISNLCLPNLSEAESGIVGQMGRLRRISFPRLSRMPSNGIVGTDTLLSAEFPSLTEYGERAFYVCGRQISHLDIRSLADVDENLFYPGLMRPQHLTSLNVASMSFEKFSEISSYIGQDFSGCSLTCSDGTYII